METAEISLDHPLITSPPTQPPRQPEHTPAAVNGPNRPASPLGDLACRQLSDESNQAGFPLFALAYNLVNFLRQLALPKPVRHLSLTTQPEKLIKIGAKVTWHSKYVTFQLAKVAVTRHLFATILDRIARLAIPPPLVTGHEA